MKITGETIKNSMVAKLITILPSNVEIYKEEQVELSFPHAFLYQLSVRTIEDRRDHYFQTYTMNLRYREVADVETEPRIEKKLDAISNILITDFTDIVIGDKPYKLLERSCEKVDKVLHFTCQVRVQVAREPIEGIKMLELEQNTIVKGDN